MELIDNIQLMLRITKDFGMIQLEKQEEPQKLLSIYLKYLPSRYKKVGKEYKLYDTIPE